MEKKINIILADDEPDFRETMGESLELFLSRNGVNYNLVLAENGADFIFKFTNQKFDIAIIDNQMPRKTGLDCIKELISEIKMRRTKVILMSGLLGEAEIKKALENGVREIMAKPFTGNELAQRVMKFIPQPDKEKSSPKV